MFIVTKASQSTSGYEVRMHYCIKNLKSIKQTKLLESMDVIVHFSDNFQKQNFSMPQTQLMPH